MRPLVIYHAPCADGFGAAWAIWKARPDCDFVAAKHGDAPPDVAGRNVFIVDFSYKRPVLEAMAAVAERITVLDHHKTAQEDLQPLLDAGVIAGKFDMEKSGAMLAWEHFHPNIASPSLLKRIQDRDLWRFTFTDTRDVSAALFSFPYDFEVWDRLMFRTSLHALAEDGRAIERKHIKDVDEQAAMPAFRMRIGGMDVPVVNSLWFYTSDLAGKLAEGQPFAACYWDEPDARVFSLRSRGDACIDVGQVAAQYGGGGHRNAAGFRAPPGWMGDGVPLDDAAQRLLRRLTDPEDLGHAVSAEVRKLAGSALRFGAI